MKPLRIRKTKIVKKVEIKKPTDAKSTHKIRKVPKRKGKNTIEITLQEKVLPTQNIQLPPETRELIIDNNMAKVDNLVKAKSKPHLLPKKSFKKFIWLLIIAALLVIGIVLVVVLT